MALVKVVDYPAFVETHGLATGEAALKELGSILRSNVRCADPVGRVATDEFGLVLVHTTAVEAHDIVDRIAEVVARNSFPRRKRLKIEYTLAAFPEGGDELSELLVTARRRMAAVHAGAGLTAASGETPGRAGDVDGASGSSSPFTNR
jgi:diguanylate cyclase (GGDEF)-like protein